MEKSLPFDEAVSVSILLPDKLVFESINDLADFVDGEGQFKPDSAIPMSELVAMEFYGLLLRTQEGVYTVNPEAERYILNNGDKSFLQKACLHNELMRAIYIKMPSETDHKGVVKVVNRELDKLGVSRKQAQVLSKLFIENGIFAGLLKRNKSKKGAPMRLQKVALTR